MPTSNERKMLSSNEAFKELRKTLPEHLPKCKKFGVDIIVINSYQNVFPIGGRHV